MFVTPARYSNWFSTILALSSVSILLPNTKIRGWLKRFISVVVWFVSYIRLIFNLKYTYIEFQHYNREDEHSVYVTFNFWGFFLKLDSGYKTPKNGSLYRNCNYRPQRSFQRCLKVAFSPSVIFIHFSLNLARAFRFARLQPFPPPK